MKETEHQRIQTVGSPAGTEDGYASSEPDRFDQLMELLDLYITSAENQLNERS